MDIGWTQNVAILEGCESLEERTRYIRAVNRFGWTKAELLEQIRAKAHLENSLDFIDEIRYTEENTTVKGASRHASIQNTQRHGVGSVGTSPPMTSSSPGKRDWSAGSGTPTSPTTGRTDTAIANLQMQTYVTVHIEAATQGDAEALAKTMKYFEACGTVRLISKHWYKGPGCLFRASEAFYG